MTYSQQLNISIINAKIHCKKWEIIEMDYGNLYKRKDLVHFIYNLQCVNQEFNWQRCKKKSDKRTDTPTNILQKLISQPWETKLYLTNLYLMNF